MLRSLIGGSMVIFVIFLTACGPEEEQSKPDLDDTQPQPGSQPIQVVVAPLTAAFLTTADMEADTVVPLSDYEMRQAINYESFMYNNDPYYSLTDTTPSCVDQIFEKTIMIGTVGKIEFGATADLSACMTAEMEIEGDITYTANMKIFASFTSEGVDFTEFDGKSIDELMGGDDFSDFDSEGEDFNTLMNMEMKFAVVGSDSSNGSTTTMNSEGFSISMTADADAGYCENTLDSGVISVTDGCTEIYRAGTSKYEIDGVADPEKEVEDFVKAVAVGIKYTEDDETNPYFAEGAFDITINNWTGTLTFTDSVTAPNYTVSDGTDDFEGTIGEISTTLTARTQDNVMKRAGARINRLRAALQKALAN